MGQILMYGDNKCPPLWPMFGFSLRLHCLQLVVERGNFVRENLYRLNAEALRYGAVDVRLRARAVFVDRG